MVEIDKYTKVADGNFVTVKETGGVQIKMRGNYGKPSLLNYITYNV